MRIQIAGCTAGSHFDDLSDDGNKWIGVLDEDHICNRDPAECRSATECLSVLERVVRYTFVMIILSLTKYVNIVIP